MLPQKQENLLVSFLMLHLLSCKELSTALAAASSWIRAVGLFTGSCSGMIYPSRKLGLLRVINVQHTIGIVHGTWI